jgi:hypothetical protein
MDHDQRFKTLIQVFFTDFLVLFFASWAGRLQSATVEWLDKEVFPDPPEGPRRALDLVGKLATRAAVPGRPADDPGQFLALVHIEIESPDKATPLRPRMFRSYVHLREKYRLPVLPIALYLKVGLDGVGVDGYDEHFWELHPVHFEYLYVGLPGLDALQYVHGDNWLGVALSALMRIPKNRIAWLGAEALRRLHSAPLSDQQRFLLAECVQAYLPLDPEQQGEFEKLVATEHFQGVRAMNTTWFEKGIEKERRETIRELLEERFGALPAQAQERLQTLSMEQLKSLRKLLLHAASLRELGLED